MSSVPHDCARLLPAVLLAAGVLTGCGADDGAQSASEYSTEFVCTATQAEPGRPLVYFSPFDEAEKQALCILDTAREEVLVAQYNIRRQSYLDKLVELRDRGVVVRVAVDAANSRNEWNTGDDFLEQNGIELVRVTPSNSRSIMHLKVTVVDETFVMTGSFNWNTTASIANDENMIVLREPALAPLYRNEVLEVLGAQPRVVEGGPVSDQMELHFTPEEKLDIPLVAALDQAQESIDVAMYTFTSTAAADAMVDAVARGVRVRAVLEDKQLGGTQADERIVAGGVDLVRARNQIGPFSAMHQKYAVIDGRRVVTGAANWTYQGLRTNAEDLLLLDFPVLAAKYERNFADLLYVYDERDVDDVTPNDSAGVLFRAVHEATGWGDTVVVTGSHPELGNWDPWRGIRMETSDDMFPNWTGACYLPAGSSVEYKYVTITAAGAVVWESGPNRTLQIPASGRAVVMSGPFGDTSINYTPTDPQ